MSRKLYGIALLGVTILSCPCLAEQGSSDVSLPSLRIRAGEHAAFDRIVFDVPKGAKPALVRDGASVRLSFSIAARLTLRQPDIQRAKAFHVLDGATGEAPLVLGFAIDPQAKIKSFENEGSFVVDVYGDRMASNPKAQPKTPAPAPEIKKADAPEKTLALSEEEKKSPPSVSSPKEDPTLAPTPAPAPVKNVKLLQELDAPAKPLPPAMEAKQAEQLYSIAREKKPEPILHFNPDVPVGAAVFSRGGYVTILFDRKLAAASYQEGLDQRVKAEPVELPYNSGFRFQIPEGIEVRATRKDTTWEVYITTATKGPGVTTDFVTQPDFALGARLLLPTASPPDPIYYTDPIVGDRLLVLPLRENSAFTVMRRMADFQIIPSAQGLVIKPWHDRVVARIVPDGLELTSEGGLRLSSPRDTGAYAYKGKERASSVKKMFAFDVWAGRSDETFSETRQKLLQTVVDVPEDQRILARMDLARFYFAHGMGKEAAALLDVIGKSLHEIESHPDFIALRGAARIMSGRLEEGGVDLDSDMLSGVPEITLWQGIASAMGRDWTSAIERFRLTFSLLDQYPEPFRSRYIVLAIESAFAAGDRTVAHEWIEAMEKEGTDPSSAFAVKYLKGVYLAMAGKTSEAGSLWREVTDGMDRLYKIRAELALVDLGVATKSITPKQAVDRLEGLRFAWRGDNLEFDILRRLGGFYLDAKEYRKGLLVYGQALRLYPASPLAVGLRAEMKDVFKNLFLSKEHAMPPLEALGLYSDFKNLIPEEEDGNKVRRVLAERLVDIDLLDEAGNLLSEIIQNSSSALERAQTGARLAAVRLLDHKAQAALAALDRGEGEAVSLGQEIRNERAFLRVRALSELGRYDDALVSMPPEDTIKAKLLRADIAMRAKKWDDAALALLSLVGTPPADGERLDEEKAGWVANIALALAQNGDVDGLSRLTDAYGSAMQKTSKSDLFSILTRPEKMTQTKDLEAAQARLSEVDMFKSFLDAYRSGDEKKP